MTQPSATLAAILRAIPRRYRSTARPAPGAVTQTDPDSPIARLARPSNRCGRRRLCPSARWRSARRVHRRAGRAHRRGPAPRCRRPRVPGALQEYRHPVVGEYLELRRQETADQRQLRTAINTVAHPAKPPRLAPGAGRESLARLRRGFFGIMATGGADRASVAESTAGPHRRGPRVHAARAARRPGARPPATARRAGVGPRVRQYEAIREKQGPRSGSEEANAQGLLARQRGVAVEILAARALGAASGPGVPIRITPW